MIHTIHKGTHRALPFSFGLHRGKTSETKRIMFGGSCVYTPLDWENDYNKLFGWSYGLHHKNSVRVGWRPNENRIEVCLYVYDQGKLKISDRTLLLHPRMLYDMTLCVESRGDRYMLHVHDIGLLTLDTDDLIKSTWGYNLGLYFGGQGVSPHKMKVDIQQHEEDF